MPDGALTFAARVLGPCELVKDCSWEHRMSSVLRLRDTGGRTWFLKRHGDRDRYDRELNAYREWAPALGDSAPRLRAFDDPLDAIIISAVPGEPAPWPGQGTESPAEQEIQRQAGMILRRLHEAQPPVPCHGFGAAKVKEFDQFAPLAGNLLTRCELAAARAAVAALDGTPCDGLVPCHRDYTPRNWLVNDGVVRIVDFEWARLDTGISDLGRLELGIWADRPDLKQAFLAGYGLRLSDTDRVLLRGCAVVTALWLIAYSLQTRRPAFAEANRDALLRLLRAG